MKKKYLISYLFILFIVSIGQAQSYFVTPSSFIDSIFVAIKNNDFEKFNRQFVSTEEIPYTYEKKHLETLSVEGQKKYIESIKRNTKKRSSKIYQILKDTIDKYNLNLNNQLANKFKLFPKVFESGVIYKSREANFYFLKDSLIINISPFMFFNYDNHWKVKRDIDIDIYKYNEKNYSDEFKPYFINTIPENFLDFSHRVYSLIKEKKLDELLNEFPDENEFRNIRSWGSERNFINAYDELKVRKIKLKNEFSKFDIITGIVPEKTYIYWNKKKSLREPNLQIILNLETKNGNKKLEIISIVTEDKIFINEIKTDLKPAN